MMVFLISERRTITLISQQERVEDDAEYEIIGAKMTRNMKLP